MTMLQLYVKFRGATYVLSPQCLEAFVAASLQLDPSEEPLRRMARLIRVAQHVVAQHPPRTPQTRAMEILQTEVVGSLNDFFQSLRASTDLVNKLPLGAMITGTGALGELNKLLDASTAVQSLRLAKKQIAEAAKVFPALKQAGLDAKLDELIKYWEEWDKFLRGGKWMEGVLAGLNQLKQGRETLKKKIFDVQRPIVQLIEKVEGFESPYEGKK